ncbi:MAG: hypothetical protein QHH06_12190 [Clostridiales bacterium]|jgi:hypothetical protein|nr:hypothetical protein [Eubacteriales bacterium]MDH7567212.1 hypothetical protein [Clostridiales bacterium]
MKKIILFPMIFIVILIFSPCTPQNASLSTATNSNGTLNSSKIKSEYFYRGFATVKEDDISTYPRGTYVIETEEEWHNFMDKYVPGIPYDVVVDFSTESLIYDGIFPARPTYSQAFDIKGLTLKNNRIQVEYTDEPTHVYAQNIEGVEHCFVNIVKVSKKDIPENTQNKYPVTSMSNILGQRQGD